MEHPNFIRALKGFQSVSVNDYMLINDKLARVIVTCSGNDFTKEILYQKLSEQFAGQAAPVRGSFRWLDQGSHAIGYITLNKETREVTTRAELSKYRELSNSLYLDETDKSMWQLREGAGGKYLCREGGHDNLAELIEASRIPPRGSTPRMSRVIMEAAKMHEVIAFVDSSGFSAETDYGFCVGTDKKTGDYVVVSSTTRQLVNVPANCVVSAVYTEGSQFDATQKVRLEVKAAGDTTQSIEYYRKLYVYAPDYLRMVIEQIEQTAAM